MSDTNTITIRIPKEEYVEYVKAIRSRKESIIDCNNKVFLNGIQKEIELFSNNPAKVKQEDTSVSTVTIQVPREEYDKYLEIIKFRGSNRSYNEKVFLNSMKQELKALKRGRKEVKT